MRTRASSAHGIGIGIGIGFDMIQPSPPQRKWQIGAHCSLFVACVLVCLAIALVEGKDLNFDFRNYHLYGPWALLHARYDVDFMAAGPGSYLNPLAHLPLYWLVTQGVDDRIAIAVLAVLHAACPYFTFLIAHRLFSREAPRARGALSAAATALAVLSPLFWTLVGNTFTDLIVGAFLLASLYACMLAGDGGRRRWLVSGFLFGIGLALKMTLLMFVPAMAVAVLSGLNWRRPVDAIWFALGAAGGAVIAGGSSAIALHRAYGSPVFPLFNGIFNADLAATTEGMTHGRFIPDSITEFALRPLRMLDAHSMVYVEDSAPDARFAIVFLLLAVASLAFARRHLVGRALHLPGRPAGVRDHWQFWGFFVVGWVCWLLTSGNGRYAAVLFMLTGPAIVVLTRLLLPQRVAVWSVLLVAVVQAYLLAVSFDHRWTGTGWLGRWIEVEVPSGERGAHGYILADINSNSIVFPSLHPASGYFAIAGQIPQLKPAAVQRRFETFKAQWAGKMRMLMETNLPVPDRISRSRVALLGLHGLRPVSVYTSSCRSIVVSGDRSGSYQTRQTILSCPLEAVAPDRALLEKQAVMHAAFNRVAKTCRLWFPAGGDHPPLPREGGWERRYEATDVTLFSFGDQIMLSRAPFGPFDVKVGSTAKGAGAAAGKAGCSPLPRHYESDEASFWK